MDCKSSIAGSIPALASTYLDPYILKLKTNSSELLKMQYIEQFLEMALAERGIAENTLISYKRDLLDFKV